MQYTTVTVHMFSGHQSTPLSVVAARCTFTLPSRRQFGGAGWVKAVEQVAAPLKLGGADLAPLFMKLGSALGVSSGGHRLLEPGSMRPCTPSPEAVLHVLACRHQKVKLVGHRRALDGTKISCCKSAFFLAVRNATLQSLGTSVLRSHLHYEAAFFAACRGAATSSAARQATLQASAHMLTQFCMPSGTAASTLQRLR